MARPRPSALPQHVPFVLLRTVRLSKTVYCHKIGFAGRRSLGQPRAGPVAADECRLFRSHLMLCQDMGLCCPRAGFTCFGYHPYRASSAAGSDRDERMLEEIHRRHAFQVDSHCWPWNRMVRSGRTARPWQNLVHLGRECGTAGFLEVLCRNRKSQASVAAAPPVRCCSAAACLL
jgi:hypothetical protein